MTTISPWLDALPKAELHLHLEGAIPLDALWGLVEKYGGDASVPDRAALRQRLTYPDFPAFIDAWVWKNGFLRTYEDFTFIAEAVARDLARQNIIYVEMFFSPSRFVDQGMTAAGLAEAIRRGLDLVPECETWLIPDLVRDHGPENARRSGRA
jgi:adenosine deaminase